MQSILLIAGSVLFLLILPPFYRIVAGPTVIDRIVAVNMIGTKAAVLLVIIGSYYGRVDMFVDFAITYSLLNFFGSLVAARYFNRPTHPETREDAA